jgi:hypothetical protein
VRRLFADIRDGFVDHGIQLEDGDITEGIAYLADRFIEQMPFCWILDGFSGYAIILHILKEKIEDEDNEPQAQKSTAENRRPHKGALFLRLSCLMVSVMRMLRRYLS